MRRTLSLVFVVAVAGAMAGATTPAKASNDPLFSKQWNLTQVAAAPAWARSTGAGVTIGIVDTGVYLDHEDLAGKVSASANCVGGCNAGAPAADDNGHGTHVSGIAAAYKDNNKGIAGVAPDAKLVVAKALDSGGGGNSGDIAAGIRWVVAHGAKVVNLSLGDNPFVKALFGDPDFDAAIEDAWNAGAVPVVAAGNTNFLGLGSQNYGSLHALVVGATGPDGRIASYSSAIGSAQWGVMAPGGDGSNTSQGDVWSSIWDPNRPSDRNTYAYLAGTSMATPHVTGAVALLLAQGLGRDAAVQRIVGTTVPVPGCGSNTCGHGLLNVAAAVGSPSGGGANGASAGGSSGSGGSSGTSGAKTARPGAASSAAGGHASGSAATAATGATSEASTSTTAGAAGVPHEEAATAPRGDVRANTGGHGPGRAVQVGLAIVLLGGAAAGVGLLLRGLRAGATP